MFAKFLNNRTQENMRFQIYQVIKALTFLQALRLILFIERKITEKCEIAQVDIWPRLTQSVDLKSIEG